MRSLDGALDLQDAVHLMDARCAGVRPRRRWFCMTSSGGNTNAANSGSEGGGCWATAGGARRSVRAVAKMTRLMWSPLSLTRDRSMPPSP